MTGDTAPKGETVTSGPGVMPAWPEAGASMYEMTGWKPVTCADRQEFFREYGDRLMVFSSLTDPDGSQFGRSMVYTEWGLRAREGDVPWLRDYKDDDGCRHYMPAPNIAWPRNRTAAADA